MANKRQFSLKEIRELRGWTQAEAAQLLGVSVDTLGNYERGKSYPDVPVIRRIEEIYGLTYDRLLFLPMDYDKIVNMI